MVKSSLITLFITAILLSGCSLQLVSSPTPVPTSTLLPTYTQLPTYTPLPTYTIAPTLEPLPTLEPMELPTLPLALPATATQSQWDFAIRIRNRTDFDVNLYRLGSSGERHFLGWLVPNYYGEYPWPGTGKWGIEYCRRAPSLDPLDHIDLGCGQTVCVVTEMWQECVVP
jgi:hypothetical protein